MAYKNIEEENTPEPTLKSFQIKYQIDIIMINISTSRQY